MADLVVVGGGPAGYSAAIYGALKGLKVELVEADRVGGVCLNRGCIPLKTFLSVSEKPSDVPPSERCRQATEILVKGVQANLRRAGVEVTSGRAVMEKAGRIEVSLPNGRKIIEGRWVLAATGSLPVVPPGIPTDVPEIKTADGFLEAVRIPSSCLIVGGGASGVELAQALKGLGCKTTLIEMTDGLLPGFDRELVNPVTKALSSKGIQIYTGTTVEGVERGAGKLEIHLSNGSAIESEQVIVAAGRRSCLEWADWSSLGIEKKGDFLKTDSSCRTTNPAVAAAGDLAGPWRLAHTAYYQGHLAVNGFLGETIDAPPDIQKGVPRVVYGYPEAVQVGEFGDDNRVGRYPLAASGRALASGDTVGLIKVAVNPAGIISGVVMVGRGVSELADLAGFLVQNRVSAERYLAGVHPHPTLSEAVAEATAVALGVSVHRLRRGL